MSRTIRGDPSLPTPADLERTCCLSSCSERRASRRAVRCAKPADAIGLQTAPSAGNYDVVVIGGGPAGLAASVYGASEGLRTLAVERVACGGQAGTSSRIENYLGFPAGLSGDELSGRARQQALRFGAELLVAPIGESASRRAADRSIATTFIQSCSKTARGSLHEPS